MNPDAPLAPPVVAVVVVHAPGEWFDEVLESLAEQDYPNLNTLFLVTGEPVDALGRDLRGLILEHLPEAFVRDVPANPGYGAAANPANGFFYAPDPSSQQACSIGGTRRVLSRSERGSS